MTKANVKRRLITLPLVPFLLPLFLLVMLAYFTYGAFLLITIWMCRCTRGVHVLLVTSESPIWQDYIETHVVPRLPASTVRLNWSQRRKWRSRSLSVQACRFFGGHTDFNPMVVVFRPFRWPKTYRLRQAFLDYKHGKTGPLESMQRELFQSLI